LKGGITRVILASMKTAISIPDAVFDEAERLAKSRGLSRSELYSRAIAEYVKSSRFMGVRERLDAVYGRDPAQSDLAPALARLQSASLPRDDW
jgi:metal-responsive CopG/Arc/MetJ family transcriptional regulator